MAPGKPKAPQARGRAPAHGWESRDLWALGRGRPHAPGADAQMLGTSGAGKSKCMPAQSCPTLRPPGLQPARLHCQRDSPGEKTAVGCHPLLQGTFPTQGSNLHLPHWHMDSSPLSALDWRPAKSGWSPQGDGALKSRPPRGPAGRAAASPFARPAHFISSVVVSHGTPPAHSLCPNPSLTAVACETPTPSPPSLPAPRGIVRLLQRGTSVGKRRRTKEGMNQRPCDRQNVRPRWKLERAKCLFRERL